jgi:hypothetical protein
MYDRVLLIVHLKRKMPIQTFIEIVFCHSMNHEEGLICRGRLHIKVETLSMFQDSFHLYGIQSLTGNQKD